MALAFSSVDSLRPRQFGDGAMAEFFFSTTSSDRQWANTNSH
jgi:hypothetical protein